MTTILLVILLAFSMLIHWAREHSYLVRARTAREAFASLERQFREDSLKAHRTAQEQQARRLFSESGIKEN